MIQEGQSSYMAVRHLYTLLCDYVMQDSEQKYSFMGVFQSILLDQAPGAIPQFFMVVAAAVDRGQGFSVKLASEDRRWEQHLATGVARDDVDAPNEDTDLIAVFAARLVDLTFPAIGKYQILVLDGDEIIHSFPFTVRLKEPTHGETSE